MLAFPDRCLLMCMTGRIKPGWGIRTSTVFGCVTLPKYWPMPTSLVREWPEDATITTGNDSEEKGLVIRSLRLGSVEWSGMRISVQEARARK